jgi:cysteinyl-tRNA synthetase
MYFCGAHYRQPIAFGPEPLAQAAANVERVREAGRRLTPGASPPQMRGLRGLANLLDAGDAPVAPPEVVALAAERQAARGARDFARADALRGEIEALGWSIRDGDDGFELRPG